MKENISDLSGEELQSAVRRITEDPGFSRMLGELGVSPQGGSAPSVPPEIMEKLPGMMAALAPLVRQGESGAKPGGKPEASEAEKRKKLLAALRPYLNDSRRGALDSILQMTEMTELLGGLKPKS